MHTASRILFLVAGLFASLCLYAAAPHPTMLTVMYNENFLPVVRVDETDPIVVVDGKEARITTTPTYVAERADTYSTRHVRVLSATLGGFDLKAVPGDPNAVSDTISSVEESNTFFFRTELQASETIRHGFLVLTVFPSWILEPNEKFIRPNVIARGLPNLPAGQPVQIRFVVPSSGPAAAYKYFIQIFDDHGQEVQANWLGLAWQYYAYIEHTKLKHAVELYESRFAHRDHTVMPLVMIRPLFPEGFTPTIKHVDAMMDVGTDGLVTAVDLEHIDDKVTRKALSDALSGWMFLPQLKAGAPVPVRIKVPLQF